MKKVASTHTSALAIGPALLSCSTLLEILRAGVHAFSKRFDIAYWRLTEEIDRIRG